VSAQTGRDRAGIVARSFFGEDLNAQIDALVADVHPRSRDQAIDQDGRMTDPAIELSRAPMQGHDPR
jgi:hypothetical protein